MQTLEIMDTTLRDGEQMQNVSYNTEEKLTLSKLLLTEVKVDRLEIASARVSAGEQKTVRKILNWAQEVGLSDKFEILSFIDGDKSAIWAKSVGVARLNLLTKGSYRHCSEQLRKTPAQHIADIEATIANILALDLQVNVYLEDFSNGIKDSPNYVMDLIEALKKLPVQRFLLPDTLGIFNPFETYDYVSQVVQAYPDLHFEFHPHNDYGVGTANALAAAKAGVRGIHATVNGMGERAGNAPLDEVVIGLRDFFGIKLNVDESKLHRVSQYVEMFSGQRMANNKPIYGKNVFTQTAGIHADGDKKAQLYSNRLKPERFNRTTKYALGKLSGKANLDMCLRELDIELPEEEKQILLQKIIELGDKKEVITVADLPYLISDVFETPETQPFKLLHCSINSTYQLKPVAAIKCSYQSRVVEAYAHGNGGYDAFMNALRDILFEFGIQMPQLLDYSVSIPPGGQTSALVQAAISWKIKRNGKFITVTTRGVDPDQNLAAIEATVKMINISFSYGD
jgi:(R)-citramalate synthase